jgi:hypothetical protein
VNRYEESPTRRLNLAFLEPAFHSLYADQWRSPVEIAAEKIKATVRPIDFVHGDDPAILDALNNFDGVFILPPSEDMTPAIIEMLTNSRAPLVVFDHDLTQYGIPSAMIFPPCMFRICWITLIRWGIGISPASTRSRESKSASRESNSGTSGGRSMDTKGNSSTSRFNRMASRGFKRTKSWAGCWTAASSQLRVVLHHAVGGYRCDARRFMSAA